MIKFMIRVGCCFSFVVVVAFAMVGKAIVHPRVDDEKMLLLLLLKLFLCGVGVD